MIDYSPEAHKALLVGLYAPEMSLEQAEDYLEELELLAHTAGAEVLAKNLETIRKPHPATYLTKGKLERIKEEVHRRGATMVILDDDLSPTQVRNLEKFLEVPLLDRSGLILTIFSERARTAQAKTQVELARLEYQLPRLTRMWTHLSRERGGIGLKGAGEKEIETDRRRIRQRIAGLKKDLEKLDKQNATRRKHRDRVIRVALVGYTNAGKSTLMNLLAKSEVLAENKLFATLDTTVRKVAVDGIPFLLSDTVGFIRKLPHKLVESFKSTLDEVREADLLLHVVDVSNTYYLEQIRTVNATLQELDSLDKPTLMVFNKIDKLDTPDIADLKNTWIYRAEKEAVFIAANQKKGIGQLRQQVVQLVRELYQERYPGVEHVQYFDASQHANSEDPQHD